MLRKQGRKVIFGRLQESDLEAKRRPKIQYRILLGKIDGTLVKFKPYGVDKETQ
jgi:hypothetical protein